MIEDFSKEGYIKFVNQAEGTGYALTNFVNVPETLKKDKPVCILRKDVDFSLEAAFQLAQLENELGQRSTYFILLYNDFYNPLSPRGRSLIQQIKALGHEIGLHWFAEDYSVNSGEEQLRRDLTLLAEVIGQEIKTTSQHEPSITGSDNLAQVLMNDAYSDRYKDFVYVFDSSMKWRQHTPWGLIERKVNFQFLAHPAHWVFEGTSLEQKLVIVLLPRLIN